MQKLYIQYITMCNHSNELSADSCSFFFSMCCLFLCELTGVLGPQWHSLTKEEQAGYYELARKERLLHSKLYPGWSARDNYVSPAAACSLNTAWPFLYIQSLCGGFQMKLCMSAVTFYDVIGLNLRCYYVSLHLDHLFRQVHAAICQPQ